MLGGKKFIKLLGWPENSFSVFHNILQKHQKELFGQPNILKTRREAFETRIVIYLLMSW